MPVVESPYKSRVVVKLNAGVNASTGGIITKSCSLARMTVDADKDKIMDVIGDLLPCLEHSLSSVSRIEETRLEF